MIDETATRASGADPAAIAAALVAAEPSRRAAFGATLNLMVGVGLTVGFAAPFVGGAVGQALLGLVVVGMIWRLSQAMWRPNAIAVVAPLVGGQWGQSQLDIGLAAVDWAEWWEEWGLRGFRHVAWRSSGTYRDTRYSIQEVTVYRRRHQHGPGQTTHHLVVTISVPTSFAGTIDVLPAGGIMAEFDAALRKLTQDDKQRVKVDPHYDRQFDTLATANADVAKVLTPGFQQAMLTLSQQHKGLAGRFSFGQFRLYLSVPDVTFRSARLNRALPALASEADQLWWELTVPHRLIDALMGDHSGPLR